jgi:hypothetical protein
MHCHHIDMRLHALLAPLCAWRSPGCGGSRGDLAYGLNVYVEQRDMPLRSLETVWPRVPRARPRAPNQRALPKKSPRLIQQFICAHFVTARAWSRPSCTAGALHAPPADSAAHVCSCHTRRLSTVPREKRSKPPARCALRHHLHGCI